MADEALQGVVARPNDRLPSLDVLRTAAVVAVVAYHLDRVPGGWLGVDVFFVLSGFLITRLLLRPRATGRSGLSRFWSRRARRLLPAGLVCVVVTIAVGVALEPDAVGAWSRTGAASAVWVANWQQIAAGSSYFDAFGTPNALLHLWSLSVEEQVYLIWPLLIGATVAWSRRRPERHVARTVAVVAATLAAGSGALAIVLAHSVGDTTRVWFGTDTRAMTPLLGAVLAAVVTDRGWPTSVTGRRMVSAGGAAGLVLLAAAAVELDDRSPIIWHGGSVAIALASTAVVAALAMPGSTRRVIGELTLLAWFGRALSYPLYLWHWPVIVILTPGRVGVSGWGLDGIRVAVAVGLALASWSLVEQPVQVGRLGRSQQGRTGFTVAAAAMACVVVLGLATAVRHPTLAQQMEQAQRLSDGTDRRATAVTVAPADDPEADAPTRVSMFGDSVAWTFSVRATPETIGPSNTSFFQNHADWSCQLLLAPRRSSGRLDPTDSNCADWPVAWAEDVSADAPDVAVLSVGVWEVFDREFDGEWTAFGTEEFDEHLDAALDRALTVLGSAGAEVAVTTAPYPDRPSGSESPAEWIDGEATRRRFDHLNERLRAAAIRHEGIVIDLARWWCPSATGACRDDPLRYDGVHFDLDRSPAVVLDFVLSEIAAARADQPA